MKKFLYLLIAGFMVLPFFSDDEDDGAGGIVAFIVTAERRESAIM